MVSGYDKPLYILPFDHRHSYLKSLFHWQEPLSAEQRAEVAASKQVIYEGFKAAVADGVPRDRAGVLVDEEFGAAILRDAASHGAITCMPAEKSGQEEFEFEYGEDFARHYEQFNPTFAKVLVRYNPEGDAGMNKRQTERLHRLAEYLAKSKRLFMIELLVPPEKTQLERLRGDQAAYDRELRPKLMIETIQTLQNAGVEPDVWKVEGLDRHTDCEKIVETARRDGRMKVGCIILGRGSDEQKVLSWLKTASGVAGFIGFAVGRTTWWDAVAAWREKKISQEAAAVQIAKRFREWANVFEQAHRT
ncbi:MAG: 2-deoxy-5-keto-D-gluconate 6-phosphate aldolase domain-containing protein [Terriglobia bacterium]